MGKSSTTLAVSHNLFLTREQRYVLQNGTQVSTLGASVPVWFRRGNTSEPAPEVFCRYTVKASGPTLGLAHTIDGYDIVLPTADFPPPDVPPALWESLSAEDKERFWKLNPPPSTVANLKDFKDGGVEWFFFRQYSKVKRTSDDSAVHLLHFVEIKDIELLNKTLA